MKEKKDFRDIQILAVEDNAGDIRLVKEHFKDERMINHKLNFVVDGVEAMKYLKKEAPYIDTINPDLILLDLYMPKMDGLEVLKEIRSDERFCDNLVCFMTSSESEADALNLEKKDGTFYILKPVDVDNFLSLLVKAEEFLPEELKILSKKAAYQNF